MNLNFLDFEQPIAELLAQIDELNNKYGPDTVARYFRDSIKSVQDTTNFLTPEEFNARWLEG